MMPLSYADKGRPMSVCRITGPQNVKNHLADLGFSPQSLVVVKQEIAGNLIVEVKGCRMALDAGMARRIYVQEVPA
ncbi:FeoA family protein [uncultured Faecalibaculum sp.]|uniref:FeoA family protein n=2 Tax=uncultured Faecalibaculum sp. TaxID=1729681 RepID=UPI00261FDCD7|nr:FeoA family protein [uncultured Faecalibaculum sp.]